MKFTPYICCGDPNMQFSYKLVKTLAPYSHAIELGIPFSDLIADGRSIQAAAERALEAGATVDRIFSMVEKLRTEGISVPFVFMTYYNIVYAYGREKFLQRMRRAGVQGIIIPDLPFGEDVEFEKLAEQQGIGIVKLIAPNTPDNRAKQLLANESLFTYLVSTTGTTGARSNVDSGAIEFVKRIRNVASMHNVLCVGFGVSNAGQANKLVEAGASGVIIGSKLIDIYSECMNNGSMDEEKALDKIEKFAMEIAGEGKNERD